MPHQTSSVVTNITLLCIVFGLNIGGCATNKQSSASSIQAQQTSEPEQFAQIEQPTPVRKVQASQVSIPTQCRAKILVPAKFSDAKRQLRVFEGSPKFTNEPVEISWKELRYQITPARYPVETVPAQYREVTERIKTRRARVEVIGKPALYKTLSKPVTLQDAYARWKDGCLPNDEKPSQCFEYIPKQHKIFRQDIVDIPARTLQQAIPEETIEFTRKVLVKPGQGTGTPIPAEYKTIKVGTVTKSWQLKSEYQPSRYEYIPIKIKQRQENIRELPVVCYKNASKKHLTSIQQQLRQNGYKVLLTGIADQQTLAAIIKFQQDNELLIGGITVETLRKLEL